MSNAVAMLEFWRVHKLSTELKLFGASNRFMEEAMLIRLRHIRNRIAHYQVREAQEMLARAAEAVHERAVYAAFTTPRK